MDDLEAQDAYRDRYNAQRYGRREAHAIRQQYGRRVHPRYAIDDDDDEDEGPSPYWHIPFEWGFSILCVYGCLSYLALITGVPSVLAPE